MACYLYPHLKRLQLRNVTLERDCLTKVLAQWQELGICKFVQFKIDDVFSNLPVRLKRLSLNECTIDDHSPIQRLHLDTLSITHSTLLGNVRQWLPPGLRCVQIRDNHTVDNSQYQTAFRINQQDTEWILFLSKIRHVDLDCASLDMEPLGMHCLRLRGLRLSIDHLTDEHLLAFLKAPLMLKRLEITSCDCHLTSVTLQGLSTHATLKQTLEYLNLSGEFTWHRGIELLLDITNLKQMYFPCLDSKTVQSTLETALEGIKIESQMNPVFL
ncbi:hypothetical protein EDD86DRAFT_113319 [Gorgonomyces haynaldii]|nr:hypothetical protein EDD86DRAFT_113319 [Gorgonomyces haynaldii]